MKKTVSWIIGLTLALVCLLSLQVTAVADDVIDNAPYTEDSVYFTEEILLGCRADAGMGSPASNSLDELNASIYREMTTYIQEVAAGSRTSTEFAVSANLSCLSWTASELGCALVSGGQITQEASDAIESRVSAAIHSKRIMDALSADLPYEMYWFDKTVGMNLAFSISGNSSRLSVVSVRLRFAVSADYSASGATGTLATHPQKTAKAASAAQNARSIVDAHADKSDLAKLEAYRDEICRLVTYNDTAANGSLPYGDPWQLIYVFDGDSTTNVVFEGYAKAFKYLCDLSTFSSNVYCYLASGIMTSDSMSGGHMWNVVEIGGNNYIVDITNVDGNAVGKGNKLFLVGAVSSDAGRTHTVSWKTSSFPFFQTKTTVVYSYYEDEAGMFCAGYLAISATPYAENSPKSYTVTVTGGEGNGSYTAGTTVTLTAAPAPDGQIFDRWVIESGNPTLSDKTAATTSFVMPAADVTVRATYVPLHIHAHGTDWVASDTEHWHECSCGDKIDVATHDFVWVTDKEATEDETGLRHEACTACGATRSENTPLPTLAHTHAMRPIPAVASTCTKAGNNAYYLCTKCGNHYTDVTGTTSTTPNEQTLPLATHVYDSAWKYNSDSHWKECACGDKDVAIGHSHKQTTSTPPTCTEAGEDAYACECGHGYTESVTATGHAYASTVTKQPTIEKVGMRTYVCSTCGDTYSEDIPKLTPPETQPEATTTEPEATTFEPEETTTEPEETTTEPEVATTEPEETTTEPEETTTESEETTTEPEVTTTEPEVTTTEPEETGLGTIALPDLLAGGCSSNVSASALTLLLLSLGAGFALCRCRCRRQDDV